ncbi:O-antigen translocase [Mariniflexile litorale]|uniref:O-antigen translocase n=1 Tax=Mariniflexile litorale TaxID=3045158 RepID=A0AAU7EFR0_9FLAO|nr:O-antigen translocase [Mariniflexile sp. KMM 9835]MDQ8211505.1 O-antigen translocase [Mariniflexile sp. KMM 9835]
MKEHKSSYRQIMKATSLFGGVQVFNIIISIIKSKAIAVLLGPKGMGIASLLSSTVELISSLTNFRLGNSAVKDIAAAHTSGDDNKISKIISVFRKLVWVTGILGAIVTIILAPWLSEFTFGNNHYTWAFVWISVTLLLNQLSSGQLVLLQGMRQLNYLAKANMVGAVAGLCIAVPIYYFYGIDGIVPTMIITSIVSMLTSWYFSNKIKIKTIPVSKKDLITDGKGMMQLGFMLSLSSLMTVGESFLVRSYISNTGGLEDVGLYGAGFAIIGTYVGLIFSAMGTDYFPRLSGVAHDNKETKILVNQQSEIGVLILAPLLTVFLIFINWIVIILYSTKFIPVNDMIHWAALGMFFKVVSWAIGFILIAKGASKTFFWSELLGTSYLLILNLLGYHFFGLEGLGVSFFIAYFLVLIQVYLIAKYKYQFSFNLEFSKIFAIQFLLAIVCFLISRYMPSPYSYIAGTAIIIITSWYTYIELDKRLDIKNIIKKFTKK